MTDKTYEYEGKTLVKVPEPLDTGCLKCFFFEKDCSQFLNKNSCISGKDGNLEDMIFVEVEPVNKIMINTEKLKKAIQEKLKDKSLGQASKESKIGRIRLFNASEGKIPSLLTFEKLCIWLKVHQSAFFLEEEPEKIPCHACQGSGCTVCNGMGFYYR